MHGEDLTMRVATCWTECGRFAALDGALWLAYTEVGPYVRSPCRAARAAACLNGLQGGRVLGWPVAPIGVASDLAAVEQVLQGGAGVRDAQGFTHLVRGLRRTGPLEVIEEARYVAGASPERGTRGRASRSIGCRVGCREDWSIDWSAT